MVQSLQELIDFLLNEVALSGSQGATLSEVLKAIEVFYSTPPGNESSRQQNVDRRFKAKVWLWLTRNPEVSVGTNREWNHLSLDDAEQLDGQTNRASHAHGSDGEDEEASPAGSALDLRIFVSTERTWYAVTGHEPDETKVPYSEFVLLSIIASRKFSGIPQTELVRLSGQDKRSVPKRTDALKRKGYIEKRAIQVKSARTSLCTLCRFLNAPSVTSGLKSQNETKTKDLIDFDVFTSTLFDIMKRHRIISRNDLKSLLGFDDPWRWRILSRALRKFERIGVLKRVRAESQYDRLHPCVMLLRDPTTRDLEMFHEYSREGINAGEDDRVEMDDMELDDDTANKKSTLGQDGDDSAIDKKENIVDAGRTVPSWTPDRNLNNQVFDVIAQAGVTGITNQDINRICFGSFYKRPSESMIHRLVDCWQISQPPHLRHLAIVRDVAIEKTILYYVHYSAENFAKRVDAGEASWEAVEFPAKKAKSFNVNIPPVDATAQLDQYGLPQILPRGLVKNGNITLFEGIAMCKPADYGLTSSDPMPYHTPDGRSGVQKGNVKTSSTTLSPFKSQPIRKGRPKGSLNRSKLPKVETSSPGPLDLLESPTFDATEVMPGDNTPNLPASSKKKKQEKYRGMSRKEKFEAMGMDESWTEYSALVMEKPTPGIYVTSHGRRRPAGKKQGRPRQSRIAVFKSSKLASFPWFVKEKSDSDEENELEKDPLTTVNTEDITTRRSVEDIEATPRRHTRGKRGQKSLEITDSPGVSRDIDSPTMERPRKQPRLQKKGDKVDTMVPTLPELMDQEERPEEASIDPQCKFTAGHPLSSEENQPRTPKRRRVSKSDEANVEDVSASQALDTPVDQQMRPPQSFKPPPRNFSRQPTPHSVHVTPKETRSQTPKSSGPGERGGSVNILRRKIVMDIVEKAGGAYPAGNEIWYPFATAWMKMKYKEKPDMRTVKTAIRALVDSGKLRQLTFSGKDPKGIMVTKTLLTKPEMPADDPLVKEMQEKTLASDRLEPTISFSPHVETSRLITRHSGRTGAHRFSLPVVSGATVQLQSKPVAVRLEEGRKERRIQKEIFKRLIEENGPPARSGSRRLMRIPRPSAQDPSGADNQTWISRPDEALNAGRRYKKGPSRPVGRPKGLVKILSSIGPMAMLMRPGQTFHASTGTFGTLSTGAGLRAARRYKTKQATVSFTDAADSVDKLIRLARQNKDLPAAPGTTTATPPKDNFHSMADKILEWELGHEEIFDSILEHRPYIEQTVDGHLPAPIEGQIRFQIDQQTPARELRRPQQPRTRRRRTAAPTTMATQLTGRRSPVLEAIQNEAPPEGRRLAYHRRRRDLRPISETLFRKIMVAIVAVRTLAGGTEGKMVDWDLLCLAFPQHDPNFIKERGVRIQARNRMEMLRMQRDFQERYLEAYANDQVPPINYEDLEGYDWPAVVEWANVELEFSTSGKVPTLPATREQFDSMFELREEPVTLAEELHQTVGGVTIAHRRQIMARVPFAVELPRHVEVSRKKELEELDIAKTWVRANVLTPEDRYNPEQAKQTLAPFGETLLNNATQSLLTERIITMGNRGRVQPGRNYNVHEYFSAQLDRRRAIDAEQLRRAASFKTTILDPALQSGEVYMVDYLAPDGDSLALTELSARGYIELHPQNPPQEKFGLMDGGYLTRQMDKARLRFNIEVRASSSYVYGNPLEDRIRDIQAPLPPPSKKMPVWFDIHGCLMPEYWQKAIASVLGCLVLRPGLTTDSIKNTIKPAMGAWEIELLLEWLVEVEAVRSSGKGWMLQQWWWMVLI
ncbi:uncharacterized protein N7459_004848 [Penicillium hispanicum]|uniref:uncharacterized protein n=1 Tax=Penicillium hispanicum TaxID=1080232 RepID=UPI00253F8B04|nr:uncharacterized protein N7459_004848 [Penicillium hispanicum]KAJ5585048.1 hypothetical protein N7459_004848 [Penicillium hispanicum]